MPESAALPEERVLVTPDLRLLSLSNVPEKHPIYGMDCYAARAVVDNLSDDVRRSLRFFLDKNGNFDPTIVTIQGSLRSVLAQAGFDGFNPHPDCTQMKLRPDDVLEVTTLLHSMQQSRHEQMFSVLKKASTLYSRGKNGASPTAIARIGIFPHTCMLKGDGLVDAITDTLDITNVKMHGEATLSIPHETPLFTFSDSLYEPESLIALLNGSGARARLRQYSIAHRDLQPKLASGELQVGTLPIVSNPDHYILLQPALLNEDGEVIEDVEHGFSVIMDPRESGYCLKEGPRHSEVYATNGRTVSLKQARVTARAFTQSSRAS